MKWFQLSSHCQKTSSSTCVFYILHNSEPTLCLKHLPLKGGISIPFATMSWQSYVDDHLMCQLQSGQHLAHAAILGQDGAVWAQSKDFPAISADEVAKIMSGLGDPAVLGATGIFIGKEKYMAIGSEKDSVLRGKKGTGGCTIKKTVGALVIGIYAEPVQPAECNVIVENLGDYLAGQGI